MNDKQRLLHWMNEHGYNNRTLAAATGDVHTSIYYMTAGDREVNAAFKWRFQQAFGYEEAQKVFGTVAAPPLAEPQ